MNTTDLGIKRLQKKPVAATFKYYPGTLIPVDDKSDFYLMEYDTSYQRAQYKAAQTQTASLPIPGIENKNISLAKQARPVIRFRESKPGRKFRMN